MLPYGEIDFGSLSTVYESPKALVQAAVVGRFKLYVSAIGFELLMVLAMNEY